MKHSEIHEFFKSDAVVALLSEAYANGNIKLDYCQIMFNDEDMCEDFYRSTDKCFVVFEAIKKMLYFIDDVINHRFDLSTLNDNQLSRLYFVMIKQYENTSLLRKIKYYYNDSAARNTIYVLPEYFVFERVAWYYESELDTDEAYGLTSDFVEIAKQYKQLEQVKDVFYSKIKQAANERKTLKELNAI